MEEAAIAAGEAVSAESAPATPEQVVPDAPVSAPAEAGDFDFGRLSPETQARIQKRFDTLTGRSTEAERKLAEYERSLKERDARIEYLMAQIGPKQEPRAQGQKPTQGSPGGRVPQRRLLRVVGGLWPPDGSSKASRSQAPARS